MGTNLKKGFVEVLLMLKRTQTRKKNIQKCCIGSTREIMDHYFGRKVVCSFAFHIRLDLPKQGTSYRTLGRPPMIIMGISSWFHNVLTYNGEVIAYWTNFLVEYSLKLKTKIIWELGHTLGIVGKPYMWIRFNENDLEMCLT
jgi:hypothetical protein